MSTTPLQEAAAPIEVKAPADVDAASIAPQIEAILLTAVRPVSAGKLAEAVGGGVGGVGGRRKSSKPSEDAAPEADGPMASPALLGAVREAVERLNLAYDQTGRSFRIEAVAGGYRMMTRPQFARVIAAFQASRGKTALSHAALETLAVISYKPPITRAALEAIRGVACAEILRSLIDRRLITIAGRAEELGRPILYGTTRRFLELFGLASLKDLPSVEELRPKQ
jgi:segregation and condensation protein B